PEVADPRGGERERRGMGDAARPDDEHATADRLAVAAHRKYSSRLKYRSPVSARTVTTLASGPSSRATSSATRTAAPALMPTSNPSCRASAAFVAYAARSVTVRTSSTTLAS